MAAYESVVSSFDELEHHFRVGTLLRDALHKRFGRSVADFNFSVRWWPSRRAPTSAFAGVYQAGTHGSDPHTPSQIGGSSMPRIEVWFVVGRNRIVEEKREALLAHAVEVMSPVPHASALLLIDAYEFFQLGNVLRERPSGLATDLAEVWLAPRVADARVVFFAFAPADMRFRCIEVDLDAARVDETLL